MFNTRLSLRRCKYLKFKLEGHFNCQSTKYRILPVINNNFKKQICNIYNRKYLIVNYQNQNLTGKRCQIL